jgi:hypothetical protein
MAIDSSVEVRFGASTDELEQGIGRAKASVQGYVASIKDLSGQLEQLSGSASGMITKVNAAASDKEAARIAADNVRNQMQLANLAYQDEMEKLKTSLALHKITEEQKTAATIKAINDRMAAQMASLDKQEANAQGNAVVLNRIANQRAVVEAKVANDIEKANDQAALKSAQEWKAVADQVAGAFNSQLQKLLSGTETWSQAMKKISADLALKFIENQIKATAEFLAEKARELAGTIAGESAKTSATTAGAALRAAAEVASGRTSILSVIANAIKSIYASGGETSAKVTAAVADEAGPAAPAIGAAAGAASVATSLGIAAPALDVGTDYVLRSGLAIVHQGEQIRPAVGSGPYTGKNERGGDAHLALNITALDSRSIERFFHDNAKHMIRAINNGIKSGAHLGLRGARA